MDVLQGYNHINPSLSNVCLGLVEVEVVIDLGCESNDQARILLTILI